MFTRTVADPSGGVKAVGKQGGNTFGVFVTRDRINNLLLPSNQSSDFAFEDRDVTGTVTRYRRDIGQQSMVGVLYAGREGGPYFNRVIGPDAQIRLGETDMVTLQYLRSETQYSTETAQQHDQPASQFGGNAVRATYDHFARFWFWGAATRTATGIPRGQRVHPARRPAPGQRLRPAAVLGNRRRVVHHDRPRGPGGARHGPRGSADRPVPGGDRAYQGPVQSTVNVGVARDKELYGGVMYDETWARVNASIKPSGAFALQLNTRFGDAVDYTNNQPATMVGLAPGIEWKVGAPLNLQLNHSYERLSVPAGWLYTANLLQFRAVWHFNRQTFIRAILQYTNISRDPSLYLQPTPAKSSKLFSHTCSLTS